MLAFFWGAVVATAAALVLQALDQFVLGTPTTGRRRSSPRSPRKGEGLFILMLLVPSAGDRRSARRDRLRRAGRGRLRVHENILYLGAAYMGGDGGSAGGLGSATGLFVVRGIFSPFAHPLFTAFIGLGSASPWSPSLILAVPRP